MTANRWDRIPDSHGIVCASFFPPSLTKHDKYDGKGGCEACILTSNHWPGNGEDDVRAKASMNRDREGMIALRGGPDATAGSLIKLGHIFSYSGFRSTRISKGKKLNDIIGVTSLFSSAKLQYSLAHFERGKLCAQRWIFGEMAEV